RPALAVRVAVRALVVHLRHVAGRPIKEDDDRVLAVVPLKDLFQVVNIVGGDAAGAGRGVAGEVDDAAEQFFLRVPDAEDAHLGVDGPGRLEDVRVALAGVRDGPAVAHPEAAVEGHGAFQPAADAGPGTDTGFVRLEDRLDDGLFDFFQVFRIGTGGM